MTTITSRDGQWVYETCRNAPGSWVQSITHVPTGTQVPYGGTIANARADVKSGAMLARVHEATGPQDNRREPDAGNQVYAPRAGLTAAAIADSDQNLARLAQLGSRADTAVWVALYPQPGDMCGGNDCDQPAAFRIRSCFSTGGGGLLHLLCRSHHAAYISVLPKIFGVPADVIRPDLIPVELVVTFPKTSEAYANGEPGSAPTRVAVRWLGDHEAHEFAAVGTES